MSTVRFQRKGRREVPRVPGGEIPLQPPPEIPRTIPGSLLGKLMPVVMIVAMGGMMAMMWTSGGMSANPTSMMFPVMMAFSMVGMFANGGGKGAKAAEINEDRKDYLRYLDEMRKDVLGTAQAQRASMEWSHPEPGLLWTLAGTSRMWERRNGDPDYLHVRVGVGGQRLATRLTAPETGPVEELEPIAALSLRRFVRAHSVVDSLPTAVAIRGFAAITIDGDRGPSRAVVRAMLMQMCTFHGPDQLLVAVVCGPEVAREWDWVKWLPHTQHPNVKDGVGSERMFYGSILQMTSSLRDLLTVRNKYSRSAPVQAGIPQIVVIVDGGILESNDSDPLHDGGIDSVTVLDIGSGYCPRLAATRGLQLLVQNGKIGARSGSGIEPFADIDQVSVHDAQQVARRLAPYRAPLIRPGEVVEEDGEAITSWAQLLDLGDIGNFNPDVMWKRRVKGARLRVPFGVGADGRPIELDVKESAEHGYGPHGLCIGATGSGKSEFLRTLVLSMLATHSPDQLNLVLVDFKGGATFLGIDDAPHVSAVITNLEGEAALVDRMYDALAGEMNRRQNLLANAGATSFKNVSDYEEARAAGADLPPLPALFIVIDEFSEMLAQQPEFAELFVMIGRLGRSLHIHLLLASQRVDEGRMRGLETHLSYRIGLKTFSATDSRAVLGVPDAYHLPGTPGAGYLKTDSEIQRFQASYVSGPYTGGGSRRELTAVHGQVEKRDVDVQARLFTADYAEFRPQDHIPAPTVVIEPEPESVDTGGPKITNLEMLIDRIRGRGREAHKIWLPPLDDAPTLDELIPRSILTGEVSATSMLKAPIGLVDLPYYQKRDPYVVDLHSAQGNVAIVGGPQSGKSNAVRSLIMALSLTHTPEQVQFYCLDFGGGTLAGIAGLPHVGSVAARVDEDRVRRTLAEVTGILRNREVSFREAGIESMSQFRSLRAADPNSSSLAAAAHADPHGDVFLVVDGYGMIRQEFDALEQPITNIGVQGLSYGVHVVITAARWAEVRPALKDMINTRIELRLGDPSDSEFGRRFAMKVPESRPGRGMTWSGKDGLHTLTALPRVDGNSDPASVSVGVAEAVAAINAANRWRRAPQVRMLPDRLTRDELRSAADWPPATLPTQPTLRVPVALNETELAPVYLNFADNPHFLIFGDTECGKTTLLRGIAEGIVEANTPEQARIIVIDVRRQLLGAVPESHLSLYASNPDQASGYANDIVGVLKRRVPGSDVTQQQLRDRSWWSGPEMFVIVDDYDLIVGQSGNPLQVLQEFLAQGKDVGFHLIIARRAGGASRAMFDPLIGRLRDLSAPGLVMSGPREEGALLGNARPAAMPPGRGTYVSRTFTGLVQVPWLPPL